MKNLISFGIFILLIVFAQFAKAQTLDEVINKHIEGLGGREKINKIRNVIKVISRNTYQEKIDITVITVHNKLYREDVTVNGIINYDMITEKEGWTYHPSSGMQKPEPKTEEEIMDYKTEIDLEGPLVDYKLKGHKAELMSNEMLGGKNYHVIKLDLAGGRLLYVYIDAVTGMIMKINSMQKQNGKKSVTVFDEYKEVEGVKMPYIIIVDFSKIKISSIKVNQVIPESAYKHDM